MSPQSPPPGPVLEVDGLRHKFDGVAAVDGVDLAIARGSITGLIGPNGAGKSTIIDVVSGLKRLQEGRVRFEGESIARWTPYRIANRGMVRTFQVSTGFGHLTTLENMLVVTDEDRFRNLGRWLVKPASITRWNEQATEQALTILREYDLADKCDTYAEELSGGQKRLLELARLAMLNPICVLLDEPTAGVSPVLIEVLIDRISQLRTSGTTVVIVEHNMDVVSRLCDDVVVLAEGRVLARGPLHEVRELRQVVEAYLG